MLEENMFVLIININSTSFIFQDKYGVLFFPLVTNMPCARETELTIQISAGKLKQREKKCYLQFWSKSASKKY